MFYYFDPLYFILVVPAVIFSLWASSKVNGTYRRYQDYKSSKNITAQDACRQVLDENGLHNVQIERIAGNLTDHYDPRTNTIRLSDSVYGSTSVAAIGVACHEAGHAIQHATGYAPLKLRNAIIPITNIGSRLAVPLIMAGLFFTWGGNNWLWLAYVGLAGFFLAVLFQLFTLPTEFDASKRAMLALEHGNYLNAEELDGSRKVLNAAAMTYVAALAVSIMQFLRLFIMVAGRGRRD